MGQHTYKRYKKMPFDTYGLRVGIQTLLNLQTILPLYDWYDTRAGITYNPLILEA